MKWLKYIGLVVCFVCFSHAKAVTMIYLERCETLTFDEERIPDAQILNGNVVFRHDSAFMYCDSAYFYEKTNSLDAFGHVKLVQGDTIQGFSDVLYYDGNTKFARMRRHVKLIHTGTTLTTDSLNYDRQNELAWYYTGGTVQDSVNTLTSLWGQYTPPTHQALFKTTVHLVNDRFTLDADTLKYNTESHIADMVGPTEIVYEEETNIHSTLGWYNTQTEKSMLLNHSLVEHTNGKSLTGDTIYYDKKIGFGKALQNVEMRDTVQMATLYGNYGEAYEHEKRGFVTDSALLIDWSSEDWMYMHADTLFSEEIPDSLLILTERDSLVVIIERDSDQIKLNNDGILADTIMQWQAPDTTYRDTTYRRVRAHHEVRVYRDDMQMVCDSLVYFAKDSIMTLYHKPICWQDDQQLSASLILVYMKDSTIDHVYGEGEALLVKQETDTYFDQLAGKEMTAFVRDGEVHQINVDGNAETIFFPQDDDGSYVGVNKTQSSYVKLYFENQKIHHIVFTTTTTGTMYPLDQATPAQMRLGSFFWADSQRPKVPGDVFLHPALAERPEQTALSAATQDEPDEESEQERKKNEKKKHNRRK